MRGEILRKICSTPFLCIFCHVVYTQESTSSIIQWYIIVCGSSKKASIVLYYTNLIITNYAISLLQNITCIIYCNGRKAQNKRSKIIEPAAIVCFNIFHETGSMSLRGMQRNHIFTFKVYFEHNEDLFVLSTKVKHILV